MLENISTKERLGAKLLFIVTGLSYEVLNILFALSPNSLAQPHRQSTVL
jgi:hypothetical protein